MNRPDLLALLAHWQKRLRLRDWRIEIAYVPDLRSKDGTRCYGLCHPFADNKQAQIAILDPSTPLHESRNPERVVEGTIVHELLHLHFAPFGGRRPAEIVAEEQAVWAITEALMGVEDTDDELRFMRAMGAFAHHQLSALASRRAARRTGMDPLIIAALKAALTADDPKAAIQALLEQIEAAGTGGESAPPAGDMAQEAPPEDKKPPMAQAENKPGMCRKGAPLAAPRAASAAPSQVELPAEVRAQLAGLDTFKRDFLLENKGNLLPETQRRWAATQPYDVVKGLLDATPEPTAERRSARASTPTKGALAGGSSSSGDHVDGIVDRRMGVAREETPAVMIDPNTNKLFITATRPVTVGVLK